MFSDYSPVHLRGDFKAQLSEHLRTVAADPRARVKVGAWRRPEAVLISVAADVPPSIRRILLLGSAAAEAAKACVGGRFTGLGQDVGTIMAWLWPHNDTEAADYFAALISAIQQHVPSVAGEAVVRSLSTAIPHDMPDAEFAALLKKVKQLVRQRHNMDV